MAGASSSFRLEAFDPLHAEAVLSWVPDPRDREAWASRADIELAPELFRRWHAANDVHPFVLLEGGVLVGYGEVWTDEGEQEAELARLVVDPARRGRGSGSRLVTLLAEEAAGLGFGEIWVRVFPWNAAALACYSGAGFVRVDPEVELEFNVGQPHDYVWMSLQGAPP